ncbi:MAG: hypothetical protein LLG00_13125 [Planctomycetaceae bacterium]|nr:hypothetical protein [Planctomycetaceae bacterium]
MPKDKIGRKQRRVRFAGILLSIRSAILTGKRYRKVEKVSHALLNIGRLSVDRLRVLLHAHALAQIQQAVPKELAVGNRIVIESGENDRHLKHAAEGLFGIGAVLAIRSMQISD